MDSPKERGIGRINLQLQIVLPLFGLVVFFPKPNIPKHFVVDFVKILLPATPTSSQTKNLSKEMFLNICFN